MKQYYSPSLSDVVLGIYIYWPWSQKRKASSYFWNQLHVGRKVMGLSYPAVSAIQESWIRDVCALTILIHRRNTSARQQSIRWLRWLGQNDLHCTPRTFLTTWWLRVFFEIYWERFIRLWSLIYATYPERNSHGISKLAIVRGRNPTAPRLLGPGDVMWNPREEIKGRGSC